MLMLPPETKQRASKYKLKLAVGAAGGGLAGVVVVGAGGLGVVVGMEGVKVVVGDGFEVVVGTGLVNVVVDVHNVGFEVVVGTRLLVVVVVALGGAGALFEVVLVDAGGFGAELSLLAKSTVGFCWAVVRDDLK